MSAIRDYFDLLALDAAEHDGGVPAQQQDGDAMAAPTLEDLRRRGLMLAAVGRQGVTYHLTPAGRDHFHATLLGGIGAEHEG